MTCTSPWPKAATCWPTSASRSPPADLALLHQRSEGWAAALQMAALSLRGATDPARAARALEVRGHAIAEYFIAEVLDQQPPEVARFMLDTSILGELTADACAAVTGRQDAAALLRRIDAAHLFLVALDEERTSFRYHHLVRQVLRAELRARDPAREQALQLRAAEWFESTGDARRAARHFLAARQADRALALLQDRVVTDFLHDPALPPPLDLSMVDPRRCWPMPPTGCWAWPLTCCCRVTPRAVASTSTCWSAPSRRSRPSSRLAARLAALRSLRYMLTGQADEAVAEALAARAIQERTQLSDEWIAAVPLILLRVYTWLEDYEAVEREAAAALATPELTEPVKLVLVPGAQALAWFEAGHLAQAADAARAAEAAGAAAGIRPAFLRRGLPARAGRPGAGAARPRRRRAAHRAGAVDIGAAAARRSSSWRCWTGPRSGPPAGRSATRWPPSRRPG